eukprot:CAMPEP_0172574386 /NCGR_PEP_ID=MMETSP1067-20121228/136673_1 /TAXON_ID=265564 ORGANISM="Thalassiosira punctigera, Strain Tpunct2005C2" /NCGR_SAMPLE_ID=MMETSP1067 /ASSEMBLY_ACC=CAM_ASM_000444 /LENGTH=224 /DNA_ID=CAMNT_0013367013 /DNA_START=140 /DNA_END=814 /DNA_ORIENTATION=+
MPKASKVGKFRAAARASSRDVKSAPLTAQYLAQKKVSAVNEDADAAKEPLSRGQRKRLAKREQYLKREKMVMWSLRLKRLEDQKGRLDGLDALREALGEAMLPSSKSNEAEGKGAEKSSNKIGNLTCNTNKSKKTLANAEIPHMGLVLQHPSFKEDPFAAIQQHLRNSLAPEVERMERESRKREEEDDEAGVKKKEERKERQREAKFSQNKRKTGFKSSRAKRI